MNTPTIAPKTFKKELSQQKEIKRGRNDSLRILFLYCGIISSLLYAGMNIFIPMLYEGYSSFSQTVSELSAVDSPTRAIWVPFGIIYGLLVTAFGWGIRLSADQNRQLRIAGSLLMAYAIIGLFWPPMHQREVLAAGGGTITDTLHIAFTLVTIPLMILAMVFGAAYFRKQFRIYSFITIAVMVLFGAMTGLMSPDMEANQPTPWMGVWERISIGGMMLWNVVFAIMLLKKGRKAEGQKGGRAEGSNFELRYSLFLI